MEKPGRLQSMGLQRVRHDLVTKQQQMSPMSRNTCSAITQGNSQLLVVMGGADIKLLIAEASTSKTSISDKHIAGYKIR